MMLKIVKEKLYFDWAILITAIIFTYCISFFETFQPVFLALLMLEIFVIVFVKFYASIPVIKITRILLGGLFIFSGFVKSVDPVGTQYRIEDYFIAFGTDWAIPLALPLSIMLNASEFLLGILLLLNIHLKFSIWLVMAMMAFFTVVTFNDALYNPVPDCGCFGDALLISNWQTFYKNLVIDALLLFLFVNRKLLTPGFSPYKEVLIFGFFFAGIILFELYNIRHLPVLDFRNWKIGNEMAQKNRLPVKYYLSYKNKETGQTVEYLSPDYPYGDSIWVAQNEFVSQRIDDPNLPLHDLSLEDEAGNNGTTEVIENPDYQFMMISYDLEDASLKNIDRIRNFIDFCNQDEISFALVTASFKETAQSFIENYQLNTEVYYADDIALKSMIRANPGLILLHNSKVVQKWHYNDWPEPEDLKNIVFESKDK